MSGSRRCIFLAGAPKVEALSWAEPDLLVNFEDPIQRFLGRKGSTTKQATQPSPTGAPPKWRSVTLNDAITGRPGRQPSRAEDKVARLNASSKALERLEDHEFLEHSIAILEDLDDSQIICTAVEDEDTVNVDLQTTCVSFATTSVTDTSTITTDDSFASASAGLVDGALTTFKVAGAIRDLKSLPKADHIQRIYPQTETVNLLVGIINVSECRTVRLRRRNADMDIIELTVGDETRAGFCVTFWLAPQTSQKPSDDLRNLLKHLRPGRVALLQNVALSTFKGNVYGQSLSKKFTRNSTTVSVIEDGSRPSFSTPIASKLQRVQDWVNDFVGVGERRISSIGKGDGRKKRKLDELPPDTQD